MSDKKEDELIEWVPDPNGFIIFSRGVGGSVGNSGGGGGAAVGNVGGLGIKRLIDGHWYRTTDGGRTYTRED